MSDIEAIRSGQPSLIEEVMTSMNSTSCMECVNTSSNTDELKDKLEILERAAGNTNPDLIQSINNVQNMIENGNTIDEIKHASFS